MDGVMIENLRHENIGKYFGFNRVRVWLAEEKARLEVEIKTLEQK